MAHKVERRCVEQILIENIGFPEPTNEKLIEQLLKDNDNGENFTIPDERTISRWKKKFRERETEEMKFERQPWSLLLNTNEKVNFTFEDTYILLRLLRVQFDQQRERLDRGRKQSKKQTKRLHKKTGESEPLRYRAFPVGVAKWAVRLSKAAPFLSDKDLLLQARWYFKLECISLLYGDSLLPDSSFADLEIAMKEETDQALIEAYNKCIGPVISIKTNERGKIIVPPELVALEDIEDVPPKKRKRR